MRTFENTTILSRRRSTVPHRNQCSTATSFCGLRFGLPLIASPMPDVCGGRMASALMELGMLGIIHRFQAIAEQVDDFLSAKWMPATGRFDNPGCAIGVTGDFADRFMALASVGCRLFCLDTANGFNDDVGEAVEQIRVMWSTFKESQKERIYLIAGNVATIEGYLYLADLKVDAVRVGIAGGSVCETRTETGVYRPTLDSVLEIAKAIKDYGPPLMPAIIADGGIREPGDMNKALVAGADMVMCGNIFAGTKEAPGEPIQLKEGKVKLFRGAASYSVQVENGKEPIYNEGRESFTPYTGSVDKIFYRYLGGLQSSMSYCDAHNLEEYRKRAILADL